VRSVVQFHFADGWVSSAWEPPRFLRSRASGDSLIRVLAERPGVGSEQRRLRLVHEWRTADGALILSLVRSDQSYILRFPHLLDFEVSDDGATVRASQSEATSPETFWHLLLDQVLPRALSHRRRHVVHAAGIAHHSVAVAFVGDTGAGKSTMAGVFAQGGEQLLSDDALVIDPVGRSHNVIPTYPSLRLWSDSLAELGLDNRDLLRVAHYSEKRRLKVPLPPAEHPRSSWPLAVIYYLDPVAPAAQTTITRLTPREAVAVLLRESFQLDVTDISATAWLLDRCARLADDIPVFRLGYPRDFHQLDGVRRTVTDHVSGLVD
jgi:hypothetical protein